MSASASAREDIATDDDERDDELHATMHQKSNPYASPERRAHIAYRAPTTPYGTSYAAADVPPGFGFLGTTTTTRVEREAQRRHEHHRAPQTPPRQSAAPGFMSAASHSTTYDAIPMATIVHQSGRYDVATGRQPTPRYYHELYDSSLSMTTATCADEGVASYTIGGSDVGGGGASDALVHDMFSSLNLGAPRASASAAASMSSSAFTTPPGSPMYGVSGGGSSISFEDVVTHASTLSTTAVATTPPLSSPKTQHSLYKTELCRSWEESGACRYGHKCQFAHGRDELRPVLRHPKYKTEVCRTFAQQGACPYGSRCRFIHYRDAASAQTSALGALVSGVNVSDWGDFLGTPAPLDRRPEYAAAQQQYVSSPSVSSPSTASPKEPERRRPTAAAAADADADEGYETPPPHESTAATTVDTDAKRIQARPKNSASASISTSGEDDDDDDDGRRLPIFSTIVASPDASPDASPSTQS